MKEKTKEMERRNARKMKEVGFRVSIPAELQAETLFNLDMKNMQEKEERKLKKQERNLRERERILAD